MFVYVVLADNGRLLAAGQTPSAALVLAIEKAAEGGHTPVAFYAGPVPGVNDEPVPLPDTVIAGLLLAHGLPVEVWVRSVSKGRPAGPARRREARLERWQVQE